MKKENCYYVYIYLDPRKSKKVSSLGFEFDYEPIYVGKGKGCRHLYHLGLKNTNQHLIHKLQKISSLNLSPIILKLKENLTNQEALKLEEKLISSIRRNIDSGSLCNCLIRGADYTERDQTFVSDRMKKQNPMFNHDSLIKMIETQKSRRHYKARSERITKNNPMHNSESVSKMIETNYKIGNYSSEKMTEKQKLVTSEGHARTGAARRKRYHEGETESLEKMQKVNKEAIEKGESHLQSQEHKERMSKKQKDLGHSGKHSFQDPIFLREHSNRMRNLINSPGEQEKRMVAKAKKCLLLHLQKFGKMTPERFVLGRGYYSLSKVEELLGDLTTHKNDFKRN